MGLWKKEKPKASNPYGLQKIKPMGPNQTSVIIRKLIKDNKELKNRVNTLEEEVKLLKGIILE